MAASPLNPGQSAGGPPPSPAGGPSSQGGPPGQSGDGSTAQKLAKLAMDANQIASDSPETAPMMRAVQDQVRKASMQMMQSHSQTLAQTPQI